MNLLDKLTGRLTAPKLTRKRIVLALLVALAADALQIPFAVPPGPEIIDVIAAVLTFWLLGFHLLLLPTFVVEFIPVVDMLPTWTACVGAVIALRKHEQGKSPPVIDVDSSPAGTTAPPVLPPSTNPPPPSPPAHD
jgi:hypothetical protein